MFVLAARRRVPVVVASAALACAGGCNDDKCYPEYYEETPVDPRIRKVSGASLYVGAEGLILRGWNQEVRPSGTSEEFLGLSANTFGGGDSTRRMAVGRAGVIRTSQDFGETWEAPEGPTSAEDLFAVQVSCATPDLAIAVGDAGVILRTTTGGQTWAPVASPTAVALREVVINWRDVVLAVGDQGALLRSVDGGATWAALESGTSENLRSISATDPCVDQINHPDDPRAVAVGDAGTLLFSDDDGASWTTLTVSPVNDLRQVTLFHPNSVLFKSALILGDRELWRWEWGQPGLTLMHAFPVRLETMISGSTPDRQGVIGDGTQFLYHAAQCFDNS